MSNIADQLRETIISHLEKGYNSDIVDSLIKFSALINIWSLKGKALCTEEDISLVALLTPDAVKNDFKPKQLIPSPEELTALATAVELNLANTPFDFESLNHFDQQTSENSKTLLTDLLTRYKEKLGNSLANETFTSTIQLIYSNSEINENTEEIHKNVIQLRYLEGYSTAVIKDILLFKVNLMEWSEKGLQFLDEPALEIIYTTLKYDSESFKINLTPITLEAAKLLTENLIKDLAKLEYQPSAKIKTISEETALDLLITLIENFREKIGSELMEQTFTSLLMEILTETSNYNKPG
jgi:hypothetical protein